MFHLSSKACYAEVMRVCLPLVMSTAAITVMEFTDRVFLSNYSLDAISAATPAGIMAYLFIVFFSGITAYGSVFVAQYDGAGAPTRIGAVLWQTLYLSVISGALLAGIAAGAEAIFRWGGHPPEIQRLEVSYFSILCQGAVLYVAQAGLAGFYTGRGHTRAVMLVTTLGMAVNIPLNYALIYGAWGFPEMGIAGAALASVACWAILLAAYALMIFNRGNDRQYHVLTAFRFDRDLFSRLLIYGVPGSLQFCLDVFAFLFFIFMVGRIGKEALAVTNIVISINSLAFMPAMGFSQGVSALVGQALGRGAPDRAAAAVTSAAHLLMVYILLLNLVYLFLPEALLALFIPSGTAAAGYAGVMGQGTVLLKIVAAYIFFDALYMIFVGALKGAGDTRFIMWSIGLATAILIVLPVYTGIRYFHLDLYFAWICITGFIAALFLVSWRRYRRGLWRTMRVIETPPDLPPHPVAEKNYCLP